MDMILINENKLKIMMSQSDMSEFELNCDSIDYDNTETRRALWSILDLAKHKTGFDAAQKRIYIQVYPSREGGCEMFVTKLGKAARTESRRDTEKQNPLARVCRFQGIYRFARGISPMLKACAALRKMGYPGRSCAYCDTKGEAAYLVLDESQGKFTFLSEFGGMRLPSPAAEYIAEHCSPVCENDAVERLAELA